MRTSTIFVSALAARTFAFAPQQVLSSLDLLGSSYECNNGVKPSIVCDDASSGTHTCSCSCTNGIVFDQPLDPFSRPANGTPDDSACQAEKSGCFLREQQLKDENAALAKAQQDAAAREQVLTDQLIANLNKPTIKYQGCMTDSASRVLNGKYEVHPAMTVQMCDTVCTGFKYFGMQVGTYCFCGDTFLQPTKMHPESECAYDCPGDKSQKCGGGWRNSVWQRNV